jgi:hypothetical protein
MIHTGLFLLYIDFLYRYKNVYDDDVVFPYQVLHPDKQHVLSTFCIFV